MSLQDAAARFASVYSEAGLEGPAWLKTRRDEAMAVFERIGFPTAKNEDWKYTKVSGLVDTPFVRAGAAAASEALKAKLAELPIADADSVLVFVDGAYDASASKLAGGEFSVSSLSVALADDPALVEAQLGSCLDPEANGFAALNAAFAADGTVLRFPRGKATDAVVHMVHLSTAGGEPTVSHLRNLIVGEAGSVGTVVEHYLGDDTAKNLTNVVTEIVAERDARIDHVVIQRSPEGTSHIARIEARQAQGSNVRSHVFTMGAELSRTELRMRLAEEHAECQLYGAYALGGEQHGDHHSWIDHAAPNTNSVELYKGVLDDSARGVFTGRIVVRPDSQHINAEQANRNILLADGAVAESRPQLEIYADDVKCSHGCAVGKLDPEQLFYLRQRGVGEEAARRLLTAAFAGEAIETLANERVRRHVEGVLAGLLGGEEVV